MDDIAISKPGPVMEYLKKLRGLSRAVPPRPDFGQVVFIWLGGVIAITVVGLLALYSHQPLVMGSFGASCFILFVVPDSPFAQPRNVIGGHCVSTLVGLLFYHFVGTEWWSMALALGTTLSMMQILRVNHPPAGSNPLIVFLGGAGWSYLITPTLVGSTALVLVALLYNNLSKSRSYPTYWF